MGAPYNFQDNWLYGSGGGVSRLFAEPSYQQGVVPNSVFAAQGRTGRAVPDMAAVGDPNSGYLVGQTQTFSDGTVKYSEYRLGGTSLSSPLFAGIMALSDSLRTANQTLSLQTTPGYDDVTGVGSPTAAILGF